MWRLVIEGEMKMIKSKISVFTSAAGGVGKTTLAMNSAKYLSQKGLDVLLIDFSLYGGLDVVIRQSKKSLGLGRLYSLYEQEKAFNLEQAIIKEENSLNCDILISALPLTMEKIDRYFMEKLLVSLHAKDYDHIIFDTSCEFSERNLKLYQLANQIIYVLTQDYSVCWRTIKHYEVLDKLMVNRSNITSVMNRCRKDIPFNIEEYEEEAKIKIRSVVPDRKGVITNLHNKGKIIVGHITDRFSKKFSNALANIWEV